MLIKERNKEKKKRITLVLHNWAQLCATTCHMASCDWQRCVLTWPTDTHLRITTRHVASCGIKLCPIMRYVLAQLTKKNKHKWSVFFFQILIYVIMVLRKHICHHFTLGESYAWHYCAHLPVLGIQLLYYIIFYQKKFYIIYY